MNWEAIGAIGEVVGAIAVVATLIYLGTQIRQSTRMSQAESLRAVNDSFTSLAMQVAGSSDVRRVWTRLPELQSIEDLDPEERVILEMMLRGIFNTVNHGFESRHLGFSATGAQESRWLQNNLLVLPVVQQWWQTSPLRDGSYGDRFVEMVNRTIREGRST